MTKTGPAVGARIMLATLALNEMEWLPALWEQHREWPGLVGWVFIEAADRVYASASPEMVTACGLSTDGTSEWLQDLSGQFRGVRYRAFGFTGGSGAQGKCEARNAYLEIADELKPTWVIVLDADEFYTREGQARVTTCLDAMRARRLVTLRQRHIWRPASIAGSPLFDLEVLGAYWDVPHIRIWPWYRGMRHRGNHNKPVRIAGASMLPSLRYDRTPGAPECVHTGFASEPVGREAKHRYYIARGEGPSDGRAMYVRCRAAWESWRPGVSLPDGARVVPYEGPVPEALCTSR